MAEEAVLVANQAAQLRQAQTNEARRREDLRRTQEARAAAAKGAEGKRQAFAWKEAGGIGLMDTRAKTAPEISGQPVSEAPDQQRAANQLAANRKADIEQQLLLEQQTQLEQQALGIAAAGEDEERQRDYLDKMMGDLSSAFQLGDKSAEATFLDGGIVTGITDAIIFTLRFLKTFVVKSFAGIHPLLDKFFPKYRLGIEKPMDFVNLTIGLGTIALTLSIVAFLGLTFMLIGFIMSDPIAATQVLGPTIVTIINGAPVAAP